jgi:Flp pilus assembly protein TadG
MPTVRKMIFARLKVTRPDSRRSGAAVTELALTLPVLVLIVLGTIEICSMIFLRQTLQLCAYQGARVALLPGSELGNVQGGCLQMLEARNIQQSTITVTPADFDQQPFGTVVTVTVTADCAANSIIRSSLYNGRQMSGQVSMMLER